MKREYKSALQHLHLANRSGGTAAVGRSFQIVAVVLVILAEKMMKMFV